ncbi:MAG: rhodanese-like domain-containing protein [Cystobacter sp.]
MSRPGDEALSGASDFEDVLPAHLDMLESGARRIDVREPEEFDGPLGHLPGAELVPLGLLEAASASWPREGPLLLICRSGKRSVTAARLLARRGFRRLYNLQGGMLAVRGASAS